MVSSIGQATMWLFVVGAAAEAVQNAASTQDATTIDDLPEIAAIIPEIVPFEEERERVLADAAKVDLALTLSEEAGNKNATAAHDSLTEAVETLRNVEMEKLDGEGILSEKLYDITSRDNLARADLRKAKVAARKHRVEAEEHIQQQLDSAMENLDEESLQAMISGEPEADEAVKARADEDQKLEKEKRQHLLAAQLKLAEALKNNPGSGEAAEVLKKSQEEVEQNFQQRKELGSKYGEKLAKAGEKKHTKNKSVVEAEKKLEKAQKDATSELEKVQKETDKEISEAEKTYENKKSALKNETEVLKDQFSKKYLGDLEKKMKDSNATIQEIYRKYEPKNLQPNVTKTSD